MRRVVIVGTGLIGASVGLALKAAGLAEEIAGWDADASELATALRLGALDRALPNAEAVLASEAEITVLSTPVLPILDWMQRLANARGPEQLVTDVGSTKREIAALAAGIYGGAGQAAFLPGHPMAGKERGGAALAEAGLFRGAAWLFTPPEGAEARPLEQAWRRAVAGFGARVQEMDAARHDAVCAWVSHLPQMLATALASLLQERFVDGDAEGISREDLGAVGGRALREMTRLGASPYSMWRDVAMTNTENVAATLLALEQQLATMRESLKTPELREIFLAANRFGEPR